MAGDITRIASTVQTSASNPGRGVAVSDRQSLPPQGQNVPPAALSASNSSSSQDSHVAARTQLTEAVSSINSHVQNLNRSLQFTVDDTLNRVIVRVVDSETDEVIREIPSEEVLSLARYLAEQAASEKPKLEGLILQAKA